MCTIIMIDIYLKNTSLTAKGALAHRLQRRKIQNGQQGPQNGRRGLERCPPLNFWALYLFWSKHFYEKRSRGRKNEKETWRKNGKETWEKNKKTGEKKKRMMKIVATTPLPAVDCQYADRWNTARSYQLEYFPIWSLSVMIVFVKGGLDKDWSLTTKNQGSVTKTQCKSSCEFNSNFYLCLVINLDLVQCCSKILGSKFYL